MIKIFSHFLILVFTIILTAQSNTIDSSQIILPDSVSLGASDSSLSKTDSLPPNKVETNSQHPKYKNSLQHYIVTDSSGKENLISLKSDFLFGLRLKPYRDDLSYIDHKDNFTWKNISVSQYSGLELSKKYDILYGRLLYFGTEWIGQEIGISAQKVTELIKTDPKVELAVAQYPGAKVKRKKTAIYIGVASVGVAYIYLISSVVTGQKEEECDYEDGFYRCTETIKPNQVSLMFAGLSLVGGGVGSLIYGLSNSSAEVKSIKVVRDAYRANKQK